MTGAGIPAEWAELERKAARVEKVRPSEIQEVARQFDAASRDASDQTSELSNAAAPLRDGGVWSGPAADAFFDYVSKIAEAGARVRDKLDEVAAELTALQDTLATVKREIEDVRQEARRTIDDRNSEAQRQADAAAAAMREYENGDRPSPPSPTAEALITAAGRENSRTATDAAQRIDDLLRQSHDAIRRAQELMKTEIGDGFAGVPEPSSAQSQQTATGGITGGGAGGGAGAGGGDAGGGGASGGGLAGYGASGPPPSSGPPPGNVEQWIREAIEILRANGIPVTEDNIDEIWTIIEKESGGNPHALNDWDSNAAKGTPSKGLMQCIDPTFDAHKLPGHGDIWDPVDNIIAGVRYTFDRYGGFEGHPGLKSMAQGGGYQGY
ncbi:transglycosylase [Saccharomonospora piscinae]|uniref:Transglycosylase n=1 Tax=Saccharomonospora piscinae TaxID=687388 RepID=A0A1V9A0L9_SACPI|nr:WXG100 family type VII secretion target [Saccharomonospora piscinae]OQO90553.1 transglycosylase [Saccharomonospora piscinae]